MNSLAQRTAGAALGLMLAGAGVALADVSLTNRDSKSHEITIKCSTTTHTSIGSNVTRGIGKGPCTVTVKSSGASGSGNGNDKLVIKNGSVSRQ